MSASSHFLHLFCTQLFAPIVDNLFDEMDERMRSSIISRMRLRAFVFSFLFAVVAHAAPDDSQRAEARRHYEAGLAHFNLREYKQAVDEFQAAYRLRPDPVFLYNLGQSYRLANDPEQALYFYRAYLRTSDNPPNRPEVRRSHRGVGEADGGQAEARDTARSRALSGRETAGRREDARDAGDERLLRRRPRRMIGAERRSTRSGGCGRPSARSSSVLRSVSASAWRRKNRRPSMRTSARLVLAR